MSCVDNSVDCWLAMYLLGLSGRSREKLDLKCFTNSHDYIYDIFSLVNQGKNTQDIMGDIREIMKPVSNEFNRIYTALIILVGSSSFFLSMDSLP